MGCRLKENYWGKRLFWLQISEKNSLWNQDLLINCGIMWATFILHVFYVWFKIPSIRTCTLLPVRKFAWTLDNSFLSESEFSFSKNNYLKADCVFPKKSSVATDWLSAYMHYVVHKISLHPTHFVLVIGFFFIRLNVLGCCFYFEVLTGC